MPYRLSFLFQVTTAPDDRTSAEPHTAGWSESLWSEGEIPADGPSVRDLADLRANLLPAEASIVGARIAAYDIVGSKLLPKGSSTSKLRRKGNSGYSTDLPQVALEINWKAAPAANSARQSLRCIPDDQMSKGEYQPTRAFKNAVAAYINEVVRFNWYFLGRDLTANQGQITSIAGNFVKTNPLFGVVLDETRVRFVNCKDDAGNPVQGSYVVSAVPAGGYTLEGMPGRTLSKASGILRVDSARLFNITSGDVVRAVVRKVGSPFASYRGRASKRRAI